jgi:hypothetical protein
VLNVTEFLQSFGPDMMIGDDQTVRGHKRAAASTVKANAALLNMLQPVCVWREVIFFLQLLQRRRVEQPKAFIRLAAERYEKVQWKG